MANHVVKESGLAVFVKQIQVTDNTVAIGTFVTKGAKHGLSGDTPRLGEDGNYYTTVDTAALIRIDASTLQFATDGLPIYWTGTALTATASTNQLVGYVDRPKPSATAGPLWVQLVPTAI